MKNITLVLTLAQLFFSVTAFLVPRSLITGSLVIRQGQGNGTLNQCESPCTPILSYVGSDSSNKCTPQACCTTAFEKAYLKCFTCIGKAENVTNYSKYQRTLDDLTSACLSDGISVPKLTFPGQNPNRTLTSFTPSGTPATTGSSGPGTGISASTITTPGATVSLTTGVASPTRTGNTGVQNANNTFSALVVLLLGILVS
ncbi:hypothetical protein F5887DRAFT_192067 [Amanita rubescens]|nr:hypothetical protein F5887DRAFT_192067 [Amanita rubescens]